jgi:glycosyltransferase involved in cell wall biosynthesis
MRIAFVTFEFPPRINGGAGIYADMITRELSSLGHEVTIFTPRFDREKMDRDIGSIRVSPVFVRRSRPMHALQFWMRLPEGIKREETNEGEFDIVHINGISYWFIHRKLTQSPHVITIHHLSKDAARSGDLSWTSRVRDFHGENGLLMTFLERRAVASVNRIIADSDYTRRRLIEEYRIEPAIVTTIRCGISHVDHPLTANEINAMRRGLCLPNKPLILFVGRINDPRKGLDILLKAFKLVLQKIDSMLIIVGKGDKTRISELEHELRIENSIIHTGYVDNMILHQLYSICDVYVCPSRLEGFGLTLLEAMNAGNPVIASATGAIPEIVKDRENGLLFAKDDYNELANGIIEILTNENLRNALVRGGIETANSYDWHSAAEQTIDLFNAVIQESEMENNHRE